jgi:fatty acid desaturase
MGSLHAPSASWQQARTLVLEGIEDRVAELRDLRLRERLTEIAMVLALWSAGAALAVAASRRMPAGGSRSLLIGLGVLLSAIAINALVLLMHEGMHGTLFRSPSWNRWVSVVLGFTVLMSFTSYQVMHLRHHAFLGDPRDPDDYSNYTGRPLRLWLMHFLRLTVGAFLYLLFIPVLSWRIGTSEQRRRIVGEYGLLGLTAAGVAWLVPGDVVLWAWGVPVVLVGYMTNIRGFTQHGIAEASDPFTASRTMKPHPLVALCLLNENYHLEHHLFPEVPSYRLRRLHELIWPRLPRAVVGRSYGGFLLRFLRATLTMDRTPIGLVIPAESDGPDRCRTHDRLSMQEEPAP